MLTAILALFNLIPGVSTIIGKVLTSYNDGKVKVTMARYSVERDKALAILNGVSGNDQQITNRLAIYAQSRALMTIVFAFALPWIIYEWKVVFVDNVLGPGCIFGHLCWEGNTFPIKGNVGDWAGTIIAAIFGTGTIGTVATMYFSHKSKDDA